jgi:VacB/RNase II family 3'-5' exoribonuclease
MQLDPAMFDEMRAGLADIRAQFKVPTVFPADVLAAADDAARRAPSEHDDRTNWPFVTLDPATSTDLDQAFHIERGTGDDLVVHYAIADVGWFVHADSVLDREAWQRGLTQYLPDGKANLYPPVLSEQAASLLPDGPRPAVVFHVAVATDGAVRLDGATRAIIHSRAKLAYDTVRPDDLPADFDELRRRISAAEQARGAARVEPPEQSVESDGSDGFTITYRPRLASEDANAAMSLATNMAVAAALHEARTGLFRVMPDPDARAIKRLRHTARAFGVSWADGESLTEFERRLDGAKPEDAAMMLAVRRAAGGASYAPFDPAEQPWHAAIAAMYAHATAPLRRLADRYVVEAALAVANGRNVPDEIDEAFTRLPDVMDRADATASQIERAVVDLAEAALLTRHIGRSYQAVVTDFDDRGARIQLCDLPVVARVAAKGVDPGEDIRVKLTAVDVERRQITLVRVA